MIFPRSSRLSGSPDAVALMACILLPLALGCNGPLGYESNGEFVYLTSEQQHTRSSMEPLTNLADAVAWTKATPGVRLGRLRLGRRYSMAVFSLNLLEVQPRRVKVEVLHAPERRSCRWFMEKHHLNACINGSLFASNPLGLVVHDGNVISPRHRTMTGYLVVSSEGRPRIVVGEQFPVSSVKEAVQSFPALIKDGAVLKELGLDSGVEAMTGPYRTDVRARRSVVGEDAAGNLVFAVTDTLADGLTFRELAVLLASLGWRNAICLDGGGSSQLSVKAGKASLEVPGVDPVPVVVGLRLRRPHPSSPAVENADATPAAIQAPHGEDASSAVPSPAPVVAPPPDAGSTPK